MSVCKTKEDAYEANDRLQRSVREKLWNQLYACEPVVIILARDRGEAIRMLNRMEAELSANPPVIL
ncbi:MAG: hypothetical protein ACR2MS_02270 [Weeksellaceae bacterium]